MSEFTQGILVALIPALIVSIITAILTVRLSMRQFYSQRWWERKAEAYSKIIETLSDLEHCYSEEFGELAYEKQFTDKEKERLRESFHDAHESITKASIIGAFIISDDVAKALSRLSSGLKEEDPQGDWFGDMLKHYNLVRTSIEEIRMLAKKDLRVK